MENLNPILIPTFTTPDDFPPLGQYKLYFKTDGQLYSLNWKGEEKLLTPGGGYIQMVNRSKYILRPNDIVIQDITQAFSVSTTNQTYHSDAFGICITQTDPNQNALIQFSGVVQVLMSSFQVNIGEFLYTGPVHREGFSHPSAAVGALGRTLESKPYGNTGLVSVLLAGGLGKV